jgi:pimeloyl-ACP methyl ester carboxylesterase
VACRAPWVVAPAVVVAGILQRIRLGETYKSRTLSLPMPVPTHVFLGSWDQVAPPHLVDEWLRAHDASSVVSVTRFTRSAHFIRYEEPEAFRAAARKILVSG